MGRFAGLSLISKPEEPYFKFWFHERIAQNADAEAAQQGQQIKEQIDKQGLERFGEAMSGLVQSGTQLVGKVEGARAARDMSQKITHQDLFFARLAKVEASDRTQGTSLHFLGIFGHWYDITALYH